MISLKNIDHVCLWVRSLAESKQYYESLFDVTCMPRESDTNTLVVESKYIHFFMSEAEVESEIPAQQHISFEVDSLASVISSLEQMGITDYQTGSVRLFKHRNYDWCEWRDPSGIRLECIEVK